MSIVSVRSLTILLVLVCIAVTAALCTAMAVASGDEALDSTKGQCDTSLTDTRGNAASALEETRRAGDSAIEACFRQASASILARTEEVLAATISGTKRQLRTSTDAYSDHARKWRDLVFSQPAARLDTYEYLLDVQLLMWADAKNYQASGVSAFFIYTAKNRAMQYYQPGPTLLNPPDGYHELRHLRCPGPRGACVQGTALAAGTLNRTVDPVWDTGFGDGTFEDPNCLPGGVSAVTGRTCMPYSKPGCRHNLAPRTNGVIDNGYCENHEYNPAETSALLLGQLLIGNSPRWIPPASLGTYMGLSVSFTFSYPNGQFIGLFSMSIESAQFSNYLSQIKVGGEGAIARVALVLGESWLAGYPIPGFNDQENHMVAVSHGNATTYIHGVIDGEEGFSQESRIVTNASDPIIRGVARHVVENVRGGFKGVNGSVLLFAMNTTLTGGGWTETVPDQRDPIAMEFKDPTTEKLRYLNGHRDEEDQFRPPLPGYMADGAEMFVSVADFPLGDGGGDALWWVVVSIDREYVLGATDRAQAETRAAIQATSDRVAEKARADEAAVRASISRSDKAVRDSLDEDRMVLYVVVAGTATALMVISVLFVAQIVAPIHRLARDMAEVSHMKLENVDENAAPSALSEVREMEASFVLMIKNLREYRSYMPASVLVDDDELDEENDEEATDVNESGSTKDSQKASTAPSSGRGRRRSTMSLASKSRQESRREAPKGVGGGLHKKKVAVLTCNGLNFSTLVAGRPPDQVTELVAKYVESVAQAVTRSKGIPDSFSGDRFYANYNAVRPAATAKTVAAEAALKCQEQAQEIFETHLKLQAAATGRPLVAAAVAGGDAVCGNMGSDGMKKFCVVGFCCSFVHVVNQQCSVWKAAVLCDGPVAGEAKQRVVIRNLLPVQFKSAQQRLCQVVSMKKVSEDEWMYQLEEGEKADCHAPFNEAVEAVSKREFSTAVEILTRDVEVNATPQHQVALEAIGRLAAERSAQS